MSDTPLISHVSDTARWVAVYRAMESERPDAIFKDPYARRLAGERGEAIMRGMPKGKQMAWPAIGRRVLALMRDVLDARASGIIPSAEHPSAKRTDEIEIEQLART